MPKSKGVSRRVHQARPKLAATSSNGAHGIQTIEKRRLTGLQAIAEDNRESGKRYAALVAGEFVNTLSIVP